MDSNHRSSGCRPDVCATGPRDREVAEIGVEPTKSPGSGHRREERWSWPLFPFAYSAVMAADMAASGRSRGRTWQAKVMSLHWALAHLRRHCLHSKLQAPESNRSDRPYESQLGASRACNEFQMTKGRVELPSPSGHDVLSVACLPVAPLGRVSSCCQNDPCGN